MSAPAVSNGVVAWSRYVERAARDVAHLDASLRDLPDDAGAEDLADLAFLAFQTGLASLLVGAEEVGRLSLAIEHALDRAASGELDLPRARDLLGPPREVLSRALHQLQNADRSGARVEGLPLTETTSALLAALPGAPAGAPPPRRPPSRTSVLPPPGASVSGASLSGTAGAQAGGGAERFVWSPSVDDDMVELFFDEAAERIEGISDKLIQLERTPEDAEVLRDLFRDMHTVKGSSAMVGLAPMNRLAHAAEDLVGQLRDGDKAADAPVTNALLGALDGLRTMLEQARSRHPLTVDPTPMLRALKDPASAPVRGAAPAQTAALVPSPATPGEPAVARQTIRVDFDKLDRLLNLVGELVLGRDGLRGAGTALSSVTGELSSDRGILRRTAPSKRHGARAPEGAERAALSAFREEIHRIERVLGSIAGDLDASTSNIDSISSELRDQVMRLRMIPVGGILRKHQRTVRDLGQSLGKRVRLVLHGEDTELDKLLVEALDEPVMHLVRNAVDHGMETPAERAAAGKPAEGTIVLSASHRGNQVMLRIRDDGRGMSPARLRQKGIEKGLITEAEAESMDDRAAMELVFRAGFSTAATVSDVSGRGVGLDVVRQTIVARLKGTIDIDSEVGRGTTFSLRLPLTLAIIQVLLARVCGEILAIPLDNVDRTIVVSPADIGLIGDREVIVVDGKNVPLVRLGAVLELPGPESDEDLHVVLTEQGGELYGLSCDHLVEKKEIVIKSLGDLLAAVPCAAGATLIGDRCALILDVPAVVLRALRRPPPVRLEKRHVADRSRGSVLVVDDSDTVRETLKRLIADAGYEVTTAEDGRAALELCKVRIFDLVSTDVMMPHMDGYELTRSLRTMPEYKDVPIVMVTSRGERIDRVRGFDAGVDDYITKPHDRQLLLRSIQKLLGHDREDP